MVDVQTIILTTIFEIIMTGIIGGIVIYVIQRKIDSAIQKSLFEHQVKFSRAFPKTLEVMETLHSKYSAFIDVCSTVGGDDLEKEKKAAQALMESLWYLHENQRYLPDRLAREVEEIFLASVHLIGEPGISEGNEFVRIGDAKSILKNLNQLNEQNTILERLYKTVAQIE